MLEVSAEHVPYHVLDLVIHARKATELRSNVGEDPLLVDFGGSVASLNLPGPGWDAA